MRLASFVALWSVAAAASKQASQNATFIAGELAQISQCALACLAETVPSVGCSLANTTCQCSSSDLVTATAKCMLASCTFAETLEVSKIQEAVCELPFQSRNKEMKIMTIICAIFTYTAVLLRFLSRILLAQTCGIDDWLILVAATSDAVFTYYGVQLYICEVLYLVTIGLVKLSVIFFYLRVFPKKSFRLLCWLMIAFCTSSVLAFILVTIFQCQPVSFAWNKSSLREGICVDYNAAAWANAGVNILQDIMIVVLPMNELRALQLGQMRKIGVYTMFGVGSFVCITSMIRLSSLKHFGFTIDATWDNAPATLWSTIETTAAILCACLPAIRAGAATLFPGVMKTTLQKSYVISADTRRAQSRIFMVQQVTVLRSRISGIDLSPPFSAWRILESTLGPRSPGVESTEDEDRAGSGRLSPFTKGWQGSRPKK